MPRPQSIMMQLLCRTTKHYNAQLGVWQSVPPFNRGIDEFQEQRRESSPPYLCAPHNSIHWDMLGLWEGAYILSFFDLLILTLVEKAEPICCRGPGTVVGPYHAGLWSWASGDSETAEFEGTVFVVTLSCCSACLRATAIQWQAI